MEKEKIILGSDFTPYTLDTYQTFSDEDIETDLVQDYNERHRTDFDQHGFDFKYDHKGYLKELADNRLKLLKENILDDVILDIEDDGEPISPREYNFGTDKADNIFTVDVAKLDAYISNISKEYEKNKIKDCDGFMWLGDEYQAKLNYYLRDVSFCKYSQENYYFDQVENVFEADYIEVIKL